MNKVFPLLATLLISALSCPKPIVQEESNDANKLPDFSSLISIDTPSFSTSYSSSSEEKHDEFYCPRYGPFRANSPNFDVTFNYTLYSIDSQKIIERMRLLDSSNNVVSAASKPSKDYVQGTQNSVTFTIPIKDYLTDNGLTLYFEILKYSNREVAKRYGATFYPIKDEVIPYSNLKSSTYTSKSFGFVGKGSYLENTREKFDFRSTGDYLNVDYYYELEFSNNYFYYPNPYVLSYKSITLRFNDSGNQFPYLTHQSNGDIVIPLSLYMENEKVTFLFKNKFYVNKKTLTISDTYRQNYVLTNRFFLPINGRSRFNNKMLYIDIVGLGLSELSTTIPLRYSVDKSLVGISKDGENYVVGGNS